MLVLAGLTDPRVTYWEPAKWVARLRAMKTDDNLLLLRTNMEAGHGGAAGRFDALKENGDRACVRAEDHGQGRGAAAATEQRFWELRFLMRREINSFFGCPAKQLG